VNPDRPVVLFLCVHNAGRSQMAAALLRRWAGDTVVVYSAGSAPGEVLNPAVVAAMAEVGVDISSERPKKLTEAMAKDADVIVTMGCGDACPVYLGKRYVDWDLPDPAGLPLERVRSIRDEIDRRVKQLVEEMDLVIAEDDPYAEDVHELLQVHLAFTRASTPAEFAFALDGTGLTDPAVTFFSARRHGELVGICALKRHGAEVAELKSMHTREAVRGQGVGRAMVRHLLDVARREGYRGVSLETGTTDDFVAARALYHEMGFQPGEPFGEYRASAHNNFMTIRLD
jgi:protein-tyrosine-phosphatase/predicted N-acetyltransferase YhbS